MQSGISLRTIFPSRKRGFIWHVKVQSRSKAIPLSLAGEAVKVGQQAPDFTLHAFEGGAMKTIKPADLKGKPTIISVVPSLDTPVCQTQTKKFNEQLAAYGDRINALTVSLDLPFRSEPLLRRRRDQEPALRQRLPGAQLR